MYKTNNQQHFLARPCSVGSTRADRADHYTTECDHTVRPLCVARRSDYTRVRSKSLAVWYYLGYSYALLNLYHIRL